MRYYLYLIWGSLLIILNEVQALPDDFVYLIDIDPTIIQEIRYFTDDNFLGRPVAGYETNECILTKQAAKQLASAQIEFKELGYSLKVFDCYRPQRAVDDFIAWSQVPDEQTTKPKYYPNIDKAKLFELGYVAKRSGHTRGSTVDLTLVLLEHPEQEIEMWTGFDYLGELSHTDNPLVPEPMRHNRDLLRAVMDKYDFENYPLEWWHYSLRNEPYPNTYFDFPIAKSK